MPRALLIAHLENATIEELKQVSRVGSNQTPTRCSAIQMLLAGADRQLVCNALLVTNRALRKWIYRFNQCLQKRRKIIGAFGSGHIGCYRQPGENPTNYRYRNVILTNAIAEINKLKGCL